ncbi:uncharacterized protein LOC111786663 [Cucurbita pepo subsp. pepo]|uniref:uncharacterized protein LOC111786663 n=1 Tax=Cucurbita pepo subsp. pepo TaxID=3664 RepID=UPI000C9D96BF|nr:uncharacterized protein LOC111786663 [Cucurbita pepo subsp. pepo]
MAEAEEFSPKPQLQEDTIDDFSFVCLNPDALDNGQIRPVFPIFDQRILADGGFQVKEETTPVRPQLKLKKQLISSTEDRTKASTTAAPELRKKSYSTGFSKLWRFGDKIPRSNSDGKETFLFLRSGSSTEKGEKRGKGETASYYHERHYARNRTESEMNKRKSYLPYRSSIMGLLSRNF